MGQTLVIPSHEGQAAVSFTDVGSGSHMPFKFSEDYNQKNLLNAMLSGSANFVGVTGLFALMGSAGFISDDAIRDYGTYTQQTSPQEQVIRAAQIEHKIVVDAISAEEMVALIRSAFGFSIVDMAKVLRVQRPTVYEWLSGNTPQEQNYKRLTAIFELAKEWNSLSNLPLAEKAKQPIVDGQTFVDLLSSEEVDVSLIKQIIKDLAQSSQDLYQEKERGSLANKLRSKGFKPHGKDPVPYGVAEVHMPLDKAGKE